MMNDGLHLDILPTPQRRLWEELTDISQEFTLYGGTAIALQIGHRNSIDFDFFCFKDIEPHTLSSSLPFLQGSKTLQQSPNTLTCLVNRGGLVQVSFFGLPNLTWIHDPIVASDTHIKIASLLDLAGMKAAVVQQRPEAKDYIDLATMFEKNVVDLPTALAAAQIIYGSSFNPELTLKALSYYGDGNLQTVPLEHKERLLDAIRTVDLDQLPVIRQAQNRTPDQGLNQ
jgi:hypothetical protein